VGEVGEVGDGEDAVINPPSMDKERDKVDVHAY
jgi:hypothetical protein